MTQIRIDSFKHYRVRVDPHDSGFVEVHEFPEECPGMREREPFLEADGVMIARLRHDAPVEFIQVFGQCVLGDLAAVLVPDGIECGDDFLGEVRRLDHLDSVGGSVTKSGNEVL